MSTRKDARRRLRPAHALGRLLTAAPAIVALVTLTLVVHPGDAGAQQPTAPPRIDVSPLVPDRVAVRFITPETGGAEHPRFLTERELAFFSRVEALIEQVPIDVDVYPERYVRAAGDRLVARAMLASLLVQRGTEPPDLPKQTLDARAGLADRLGGTAVLEDALQREGIDEAELIAFLRDQVRATWYIDRAITPIIVVSEDSLREAFRSALHPFRTMKFEDARARLKRWLVAERMRSAELEFLQSARARIKIATVLLPPADERPR